MKKRIAMLLVLVMLFALSATAMADDAVPEEGGKNELQTLSYITAMRLIEGNDLNGRFCQVGDMNIDLWVPDIMIAQEDIPEDCYWVFEDAGGNVSIKVHGVVLNEGLEELEDVEKYVTDLGGVSDGVFWINGYDALV